jgi:hypothetical protein
MSATIPRRVQWQLIVGAVCLVVGVVAIWRAFFNAPTPRDAALTAFERTLAGEVDWLYGHTVQKERSLISLNVLKEFHETWVKPEVASARIESVEDRHISANQGVLRYRLRLKDGSEADTVAFAFSEDGRIVAPAFESLFYLYATVKFRRDPNIVDRLTPAWREVSPWLLKRGVTKWYSSQDDRVCDLGGTH